MNCQNCGDGGCKYVVKRLVAYPHGQYGNQGGDQCQNCGAVAWKNGELFVPRCSLPAKELTLPDADDWWGWRNPARGKWEPVCVVMEATGPRMSRVGLPYHQSCLPGRYVRLPMPVQPEPVDADAESPSVVALRNLVEMFAPGTEQFKIIANALKKIDDDRLQATEPA